MKLRLVSREGILQWQHLKNMSVQNAEEVSEAQQGRCFRHPGNAQRRQMETIPGIRKREAVCR